MLMQNFLKLKYAFDDRPWLILGKGPSFSRVHDFNPFHYNVFGLNEIAKIIKTDLTSIIDVEILCPEVTQNSKYLIMPWHPHYKFKASKCTLDCLFHSRIPQKVYWYNLSTWHGPHHEPAYPIIKTEFFSAEAAFQILGYLGIKKVYSLGLDGGTDYAQEFTNLGLKPLGNSCTNFDGQFVNIKQTVAYFDLDYEVL